MSTRILSVLGFGAFLLIAVGSLPACSSESDSSDPGADAATGGPEAPTPPADGPTYYRDVSPLLQDHCLKCHTTGSVAPVAFDQYEVAKAYAGLIANKTQTHEMPPWGASVTDECAPRLGFVNDHSLDAGQIEMLATWAANGAPAGDEADKPPTYAPVQLGLSSVDMELKPAGGYVAEGKEDRFICFVMDPGLTEDTFFNGIDFVPGNPLVVHHLLLYLDEKNESAELVGPDGSYECFGGPGIQTTQLIGAWAPGIPPLELPENVGVPLPAGSKMIMQVHYHPIGDAADEDVTTVQFRFNDTEPEWHSLTALIGNFEGQDDGLLPGPGDVGSDPQFHVPANAVGHVEEMQFTIPAELDGEALPDLYVFAVGSHMHYLGTDMLIEVERRPPDWTACTTGAIEPVTSCVEAACAGVSDEELGGCLLQNCAAQWAGLPGECRDCLSQLAPSQGANAAVVSCSSPAQLSGPAQPEQECLLQTPYYDFTWQRFYQYAAPLEELPILRANDKLKFRCTYDNSMGNRYVVDALNFLDLESPIDVKLGDTTLDEMCLVAMQLLFKP